MAKLVGCRVYNSGSQSINNTTLTALTFDSELYDDDTMHSTVSNTSRITMTTAGRYHVGATVTFDANATGSRIVLLRLNGTTYFAKDRHMTVTTGSTTTSATVSSDYNFSATDYVEVIVYQDSGGALNVLNSGADVTGFWAHRIG